MYDDELFNKKIINKKINERDLIIFQKNLNKGTSVKIYNPSNNKSIVAKVGKNSIYPSFNNSVISKRIFLELELDSDKKILLLLKKLKHLNLKKKLQIKLQLKILV